MTKQQAEQIRGAQARLLAFVKRHAETFDEADFRASDIQLLVTFAKRRRGQ